ncbi:hypothetical protein LCGC14_0208530 [marine sediment metagenome]|uniref:EF-hand domain-containing protein n=1 Tax=marine sediment metagenome TaxID=412755 RepID=A0A0F9UXY8_9ZZZZ
MIVELAYTLCALIMLPLVDNATEYDLYTNDAYDTTLVHPDNIIKVCRNDDPLAYVCDRGDGCHTKSDYYYTARNEASESEPGEKLEVRWVWDADFDDDGIVGFADFGAFVGAFGGTDSKFDADGSEVVGFSDFGWFVQRFGECLSENLVKVVPCA